MVGFERGIANVGVFFTVNAVMLLLVRIFGGRLMDKYGLTPILIPSYLLAATAMFLVAGAKGAAVIAVAGALKALGQGSAQPAIQTTCIQQLPPEKRGVAVSTFYVGADVGQGLGGALGGTVAQTFGYTAMYCGAGVLLLAALAAYLAFAAAQKRKAA